ncbi:ABC transporter substrate-binding protein [Paenibacillus sp. FSL H7-0326]|uniref:ABC transporter substrate-binding protein n=1 Tax=Paenibacillus sp. FSL H7-0326 TaxID=1921144 RepID=UPI00096DF933|nr:ABC transporter substrate-binding protein [Paenibacillus sp. FSL H7-0326]OMC64035.1 ABC transporter substrate-binding protein [Paenibacillus sp. FSL H7-0326]
MPSKTTKFAIVPLLGMSLLAAGCGGGSNGSGEYEDTSNDTSPITFDFFSADASPNWNQMQDAVGKKITEATGVTLNGEFAVTGGGQDRVALMAASGEYPDIISAKGEVNKLVDAGALIDLTDLIEEYAPNIKALYGEYWDRLKYSTEDESIYVLPTYAGVGQQYFDATGGFKLQHRVLEELGYPEIRTTEDFEKALKDYMKLHPTTDGQPTIPLTLDADDWRIQITVTNPAFWATGAHDDGEYFINPDTFEAMLHVKRPEEREYFRWLNKLYNEGLIDKESFVQKSDQYKSKIASGRVLGLIDQEWGYADAENSLKTQGKHDQTYATFPVTMSEDILDHTFQDTGFQSGWGVGISTSNPDPVRTIKFFDYLASEEGQILINWGIEGEHYNVDENGQRVIPEEVLSEKNNNAGPFTKETGIGLYGNIAPHYGDGVKDSTGNYYTANYPEQIVASYSEADKKTLKQYGAETYKDLFPKEDEFPVKPWGAAYNMAVPSGSSYSVAFQKSQDIIRKRIPEAILTSPDKFDSVYDTMLTELDKAGVTEMEAEYTELIKQRVELWNGSNAAAE